jgi:hypothetical protein
VSSITRKRGHGSNSRLRERHDTPRARVVCSVKRRDRSAESEFEQYQQYVYRTCTTSTPTYNTPSIRTGRLAHALGHYQSPFQYGVPVPPSNARNRAAVAARGRGRGHCELEILSSPSEQVLSICIETEGSGAVP